MRIGTRIAAEDHRLVHAPADADKVVEVALDVTGVRERPRHQHRVDAGRTRHQLQRGRIADGEDDLGGHVHRIAGRSVRRKHSIDGGAGPCVEHGHREPVLLAYICEPRARTPGRGQDAHPRSLRQPIGEERERGGHVHHVFLVFAGQDAVAAKHRVVRASRPGQRRGMRCRGSGGRLGASDLGEDERLAQLRGPHGGPQELVRRADAFEEGQHDRGVVVLDEPGGDVHRIESRFVPRAHHEAEVQRLGPTAVEEGKSDAPALRDHRDAAPAAPRGPEPVLDVHHGRTERRRKRHPAVQESLGIGAEHRHVELPGDVGNHALASRTGFTPLLAEPGADHDGRLHSELPACLQGRGDMPGRNRDDREIHRPGQRLHRGMAGDAGDLVVASAHRVDRSAEFVQGHRLHDSPTNDGLVRRHADECDRTRP